MRISGHHYLGSAEVRGHMTSVDADVDGRDDDEAWGLLVMNDFGSPVKPVGYHTKRLNSARMAVTLEWSVLVAIPTAEKVVPAQRW